MLWLGATSAYLCLSELVEFRYFAIPFLIISLEIENKVIHLDIEQIHQKIEKATYRLIWTTLGKILINIIVLGLFLSW